MAIFPPLEPLRREWAFPLYPSLAFESPTWGETVFEFGDEPTDTPLELVYELLSEEEMQGLRAHFQGQQMVHPFRLPPEVWAGYTPEEAEVFFPTAGDWLYAGELEEEPQGPGIYNCTVSLISQPQP